MAPASAMEAQSLLLKGRAVGYSTDAEYARLDALAVRGLQAVARLHRYLHSAPAKRTAASIRAARRTTAPRTRNGTDDTNMSNATNEANVPHESHVPNAANAPNDPDDS